MTASCAMEAEVEELAGGVETVTGFGVIDLALHHVDEEADYKCRPSSVSSRMMSARGLGLSSFWCSVSNICSTVPGVGGWGQWGSGRRRGCGLVPGAWDKIQSIVLTSE